MRRIDRRQMLTRTAAFAAGVHLGVSRSSCAVSTNDKLNIACVGVGGKGWSDMQETSVGQNVVAICDIDEQRLAKAAEVHPQGANMWIGASYWNKTISMPSQFLLLITCTRR